MTSYLVWDIYHNVQLFFITFTKQNMLQCSANYHSLFLSKKQFNQQKYDVRIPNPPSKHFQNFQLPNKTTLSQMKEHVTSSPLNILTAQLPC